MTKPRKLEDFCCSLTVAAVLGLAPARNSADDLVVNVRLRDKSAGQRVQRAFDGARQRLKDPSCQKVFSDFTDRSGQALAAVLRDRGETGESHLRSMLFYDGSGYPNCRRGRPMAFTSPGSQVAFICTAEFSQAHPSYAEATLIHEMLHSLGLPDDWPSSEAITDRVLARCK
jgi:hypothetical protein